MIDWSDHISFVKEDVILGQEQHLRKIKGETRFGNNSASPHIWQFQLFIFFFFGFVVANTSKSCREQLWSSWLNCFITQTTPFHPGTLAHNVTACDWITRACWIAESSYMGTTLEVCSLLLHLCQVCGVIKVFSSSLLCSCPKMIMIINKLKKRQSGVDLSPVSYGWAEFLKIYKNPYWAQLLLKKKKVAMVK